MISNFTIKGNRIILKNNGVLIEDSKYYPNEFYRELEEDEYTPEILVIKWNEEIKKVSNKRHKEYMECFETIRDLLIENLIEKKTDIKGRLELISKYSNNSLDSIFLDTKFKIKYVYDIILSQKKTLSVFFSLLYIFITLIFFIHNY